jgi:hypothetical protein
MRGLLHRVNARLKQARKHQRSSHPRFELYAYQKCIVNDISLRRIAFTIWNGGDGQPGGFRSAGAANRRRAAGRPG